MLTADFNGHQMRFMECARGLAIVVFKRQYATWLIGIPCLFTFSTRRMLNSDTKMQMFYRHFISDPLVSFLRKYPFYLDTGGTINAHWFVAPCFRGKMFLMELCYRIDFCFTSFYSGLHITLSMLMFSYR